MKRIFTTKISLQSRNPTFSYPIIRLPRDLRELAGQIVNIYETEMEGVRGFFVVPHLANLAKSDEVAENNNKSYFSFSSSNEAKNKAPESGFEPESEPRQGSMIGRYTTRARARTATA